MYIISQASKSHRTFQLYIYIIVIHTWCTLCGGMGWCCTRKLLADLLSGLETNKAFFLNNSSAVLEVAICSRMMGGGGGGGCG